MQIDILLLEQITRKQPFGGVARYIRRIIGALHDKFGKRFAVDSQLKHLPSDLRHIHLPRLRFRGMHHLGLGQTILKLEDSLLNRSLARIKPGLVFSPFCDLVVTGAPQVFTVYDFALERYPDLFIKRLLPKQLARMQACYRTASALLCISESTRRDLLHFYPFVDPTRVHVTHLGVDDAFFASEPTESDKAGKYVLFVGGRDPRRNFQRFFEAFASSGLSVDYQLRVVTPRHAKSANWSKSEIEFIRAHDLETRVKLETSISEDRLRQLYHGASFFVYPSEYEGFGLPILEAMASRTIVLCSNASSLPEVAGDAAIYFDPFDVSSIGQALQKANGLSQAERGEFVERGLVRARAFSWSKCAAKTISILQEVAE